MKMQKGNRLSIVAVLLLVTVQVAGFGAFSSPTYANAESSVQTGPALLTVQALIDGRSWLIIQDNTAHWHHLDYAAPGRHEGANEPTVLNGFPWFPTWPDVPDPENRDCDCDSSPFVGVPPLAAETQTVTLQVTAARGSVTIIQQPNQRNDYTLIVEFDDNSPLGSEWYAVELTYFVGSTLIGNPGFESGKDPWTFYTDGQGYFNITEHAYAGNAAALVNITEVGKNTQFYQIGFALEPKTRYQLHFAAYSSNGQDLSIYVQQHGSPYTIYGLRNFRANLTKQWKTFTIPFTTKSFTTTTTDTRLRFWLAPFAKAGDQYWIDEVSLTKVQPGVTAALQTGVGTVVGNISGDNAGTVTLVDLESEGVLYQAAVATDATGAFQFTQVPLGTYELRITPRVGYLAPEPVQLLVTAEPNEEIVFVVERATSTVYLPQITR